MTAAIPIYGSSIEWGTDGSSWAAIPECKNVIIPDVQQDYIEVTNLDSPNGFREFIVGLKDGGEAALELNYNGTTYALAKGYSDAGTLIYFKVELPFQTGQSTTGDVFEYTALVTPSVPGGQNGEAVLMTINMRVSGEVEFTAGA